jgi:hypothetical protein
VSELLFRNGKWFLLNQEMEEEIDLGGKKKAMITFPGITAFHWVEEAGTYKSMGNPLYPFQKPSEEKRNKEYIGKDQCPNGYSLETNFNVCRCFFFTNND